MEQGSSSVNFGGNWESDKSSVKKRSSLFIRPNQGLLRKSVGGVGPTIPET